MNDVSVSLSQGSVGHVTTPVCHSLDSTEGFNSVHNGSYSSMGGFHTLLFDMPLLIMVCDSVNKLFLVNRVMRWVKR